MDLMHEERAIKMRVTDPTVVETEDMGDAVAESPPIRLLPSVSRDYLLHHGVCPTNWSESGALIVAARPDAFREALDELALAYACPVMAEEASADNVTRLIERLTTHAERLVELARIEAMPAMDDLDTDVRDLANQPPVVRYVNLLVRDAYDAGASDIHLEATGAGLSARYRLDGVLAPAQEPPANLHYAVISRIKLLAELDIAERRRPQDGRIRVRLGVRDLDLRVSTVPTIHGESVVLRLLERGGRPVELHELGMPPDVLAGVTSVAARAHGMLLVTGPTGSGKTTTLYAALARRDTAAEKIMTVEDPVEYQLAGITQMPVHRQAGVTFGSALRSILRQDPDVIMIGEMRDPETAEIAVQAAMTGHLVFSTLHTNDAAGAIPRLIDLGVPPYLVAATVDAVLAQRLVRRRCDRCHGEGCASCRGTGFRGRIGVFELIRLTREMRDAITQGATADQLADLARRAGTRSMRDDGDTKVQAGVTTVEEVLRATTE
ncbi:MAG TPA: GspE/PulE family protein [Gemmatimonadaceae bacterium]|nr:GspE/PulE family protein [Gemmatimonadaceae bacterium]